MSEFAKQSPCGTLSAHEKKYLVSDLGTFYVDRGKPEQALALFKESLQIQIDTANEENRGMLLNNIVNIYLSRGDFQDAHTYFEQALQVREKFNVTQEVAETLHNVAETDTNLGLVFGWLIYKEGMGTLSVRIGRKEEGPEKPAGSVDAGARTEE